ncbi:MAG TPA: porin family protein [Flavisolibacter sp.]|nr:porin family protein [Flavisolibacter sp.]
MKAKLFPLLSFLLLATAASAQFHLGIKGGINLTKIEGRSFNQEFRTGFHAGGFAEIGLGGNFSIQPEVLFNQINTRVDSSFSDVYQGAVNLSNYRDVQLKYLTIPLLLNYKVAKIFTLQAGPQFGILLDQNKNLLNNGGEAFKSGDFSLVGGAQIKLAGLRLTGRYLVGLNNISDISSQSKWKSQGFQLSAGFNIF